MNRAGFENYDEQTIRAAEMERDRLCGLLVCYGILQIMVAGENLLDLLGSPCPNDGISKAGAMTMTYTISQTRKAAAKQRNLASRTGSLEKYEEKQAEIEKLLKQIAAGLQAHDRAASGASGHHWGHVGDLNQIAQELEDIRDRLHGKGEYAK